MNKDFTFIESIEPELEDDMLEYNDNPLWHIQITSHDCGNCKTYSVVELKPVRYTSEDGHEYDYVFHASTHSLPEAEQIVYDNN